MAARKERHTQGGSELRAAFFFVCEDPAVLTVGRTYQIIKTVLDLVGDPERFARYVAFVEDGPHSGTRRIPEGEGLCRLPGQAEFVKPGTVVGVLNDKHLHEKPEYRKRGVPSYRPPPFLSNDVCVLAIGSRGFLADNADLYLERRGPLLSILVNAIKAICRLEGASQTSALEKSYYELDIVEGQFYEGNFDELARLVGMTEDAQQILTPAQVSRRLGLGQTTTSR